MQQSNKILGPVMMSYFSVCTLSRELGPECQIASTSAESVDVEHGALSPAEPYKRLDTSDHRWALVLPPMI